MSSPSPGRPRATATINNASSSEAENAHGADEEMTPTKDTGRRPEKRKGDGKIDLLQSSGSQTIFASDLQNRFFKYRDPQVFLRPSTFKKSDIIQLYFGLF